MCRPAYRLLDEQPWSWDFTPIAGFAEAGSKNGSAAEPAISIGTPNRLKKNVALA